MRPIWPPLAGVPVWRFATFLVVEYGREIVLASKVFEDSRAPSAEFPHRLVTAIAVFTTPVT